LISLDTSAMKKLNQFLNILLLVTVILLSAPVKGQIPGMRVLVITGGHDFDTNAFHDMFESMQGDIAYRIAALPEAFALFEPERRNAYDVIVMYHMWNIITPEQADNLADCIRQGMPLVVLHHSICAFDDWDEYRHFTGGRYFHRPDTIDAAFIRFHPIARCGKHSCP
jgi:type 1 glutamine amidotransferase